MCASLPSSLIAAAFAFALCGHPNRVSATETVGTEPYNSFELDVYVLSRPSPSDRPSDLVIYDGRMRNFDADGASTANRNWQNGRGKLYIETQRRGLDVIQAGIASASVELIDEGLTAIEWGLQPRVLGPNGSFPEQRDTKSAAGHAILPKAQFVEAAAHSVIFIRQSPVPSVEVKARANALIPSIQLAARYFIQSGDAASMFADTENSNQRAFIAAAIFQAGYLANDTAMIASADVFMQQILGTQWPSGVYPEKGGHDTGYHLVTVGLVGTYSALVANGEWRASLLNANDEAVSWYLTRVRPNGSINTRGNTRTMACGKPVAGPGPKGPGIDKLAIRLYYHAFLTGSVPEIGPIADKIQLYGQDYEHINSCDSVTDTFE